MAAFAATFETPAGVIMGSNPIMMQFGASTPIMVSAVGDGTLKVTNCPKKQFKRAQAAKRVAREVEALKQKPAGIKKEKKLKPAVLSEVKMDALIKQVFMLARDKGNCSVHLVGKETLKVDFPKMNGKIYARVGVKHMENVRVQRDLISSPLQNRWLRIAMSVTQGMHQHSVAEVKEGWSGFLLNASRITGNTSTTRGGTLVVRGAYAGKLFDARVKLNAYTTLMINQFSSPGEKFWMGFNETFISNRTQDRGHECMTNLDVLKCGQVAALLCLAMFPCGRITCQQCVDDNLHSEGQATNDRIIQRVNTMYSLIKDKYPEFKHALMILERYSKSLSNINKNYEAFAEIQRISDGRNVSAFAHITHINAVLIKGASATSEDFTQATNHLLEVTRFLKNRTENIEKGSLKHFRNKISQKAQLNPSLMCDNQLDKNGNFVWGERGRHAKRFFSNYFELINPTDGYLKYEIRNNPNGTRKLAINRLIVPTDFEALREQMKGEPVVKHPITKECVSMTNGDYVHSCCCITTDTGEPLFSELQMPTKHHLVIGNSGDPKYIDLPTLEAKRMYIAKDGYCYINIFLAMLVNVNESDAKAFTKMVRDTMIEKLGKWPTLLDVATACYFLKVFFPEVGNAELPRMYVDHTTKTIHVLDSYGSLTTGYHIMKANTVEQLIKFTRHSLESDLKHYLVGGDPLNEEATERELCDPHYNLKMLIECIYDPREMEKNLIWNKYLPIYAMLSPGVLLALYNSGSMEALMNRYLRKDNDFVVTLVVLESLARKVSVASSVAAQVQILERGAAGMIEAMQGVKQRHLIPYTAAMQMLMVMIARSEANAELDMAGYMQLRTISLEVMEKNYLQILEEGWHALSWRGKLRAMWRSSKFAICTRKGLTTTSTADLDGRYSESITSYCAQPRKLINKSVKSVKRLSTTIITKTKNKIVKSVCNTVNYIAADLIRFVNTLLAISLILTIAHEVQTLVYRYLESQRQNTHIKNENDINRLEFHYKVMRTSTGVDPTLEEFKQYIAVNAPDLMYIIEEDTTVKHQTKRKSEQGLERVIAFIALVLMMFDCERSDCVARILTKLKTLVSTVEPDVYHQKLDDIEDDLSEKRLTIDFELTQDPQLIPGREQEPSFAVWWNYQLAHSLTVPHYRTEGKLVVFTRTTAVQVANEIAGGTDDDILLIGAVGSGKSTGLPYNLSKKGNVLLIEPTRPLAENVHKQLAGDPFFANTTLRMRGLTKFGSAPITIMTSGFALNYFAHNRSRLGEFGFVIFDECHVDDANAMAFRCLMVDTGFAGKFIKMSATPPGRELDFKTQYPVNIIVEESLSLQEFARSQGSGANCDTTKHGDNILVYVASYNEVDMLANLLTEAGHKVTKVDGRTMKVGRVEILTSGTSKKKHFIVATNIIENGVTLDIEVVVDFGVKVVPYLDSDNRMMLYRKVAINYGERIQRLGRVGRNKPGTAIRIGHTEKGLSEIPSCVATEAAFKCFTYGLPVITNNVTTSILSEATVRQARTMACFEITPFYMVHLVRFDGTMHHAIHGIFKKFKLRDSEIALSKLAIPSKGLRTWLTAREYLRLGANVEDSSDVRIPFMCKDIPEKLHTEVWEAIQKFKNDAGFQRLSSASACKIAYTLQTDCLAIQRTVHIIETLMAEEKRKQEYFRTITANTVSSSTFSLQSIANAIRSRYATDHTMENIGILESAKSQLLEFQNLSIDQSFSDLNSSVGEGFLREFGALETVHHQNLGGVSETLKLRGRWNHSLITNDLFVLMGVLCGGAWMVYDKLRNGMAEDVVHEAKGKRQRQKLKFRQTRDNKVGREVYGDDGTMEHYFGAAYTKKGKTSGRTRGMGAKSRRFINMYNFDPEDFTAVRFVDPLTGATLDENPMTDIHLVQEYFTKVRNDQISEDLIEPQHIISSPGIQAYYTNNRTGKALKLDLTPHNPLALCNKHATIAGFPEREFELRQTGQPVHIDISDVPVMNEVDVVEHESSSLFKGLRDYNPIASSICQLVNKSDGHVDTLYGLGYGPLIITNRHLFERNNGELIIRTRHGEFTIRNSTTVKLLPIPDRDIILVRLPKDIPPFPQRFTFRLPKQNERVCLVGSNFQTKSISSMVSEPSTTLAMNDSHFWKHWISTKDGQCGSPIVSTQDGAILGLHSLSNFSNSVNYFASFPENFREEFLETLENHAWVQHWKYNTEHISWGALNIKAAKPADLFKTSKLVTDLEDHNVYTQVCRERWLMEQLNGNLKAIATCPSQLVTKHVVKGKCQMFDLYLRLHDDARTFFEPLLGHYQKSQLNREAYTKDIMKYATTIEAGKVDCDIFEQALSSVIRDFEHMGFETCNYVTNDDDIFGALNMKSAVGALYTGKKRDYLKDHTKEMREELLKSSCLRLFKGEMGVWNGSLKAELRPIEKVLANKTRTFTAAPIDTLLGGKVCVDDFNNQFYDLNIRAPWSVGMTKFYCGWNEMLNALPDGWVYCDADGSQFDSSLSPYLINAVLNLRLRFMEDWDIGATMLQNLYTEIVYTPISTPDCTLIKKYKGNNSGQPSTVVDNTLMVILALRYSLIKSGYEHKRHDSICRFFVNGDDLLLAVHPEYEALLDSFQETFGELGLKYTFTSRHKDKGNLWFMSHQGIRRDGIWIPKLEKERIVSILEWDRSEEPLHRTEAICAAMIEAWGYDDLMHEIRKFYAWLLEQAPFSGLAATGKAPYIAESALRRLYLNVEASQDELERYVHSIFDGFLDNTAIEVYHQSGAETFDAGREEERQRRARELKDKTEVSSSDPGGTEGGRLTQISKDKDINVGTHGTFSVPRLKHKVSKMNLPKFKGRNAINLDHLIQYEPEQTNISNTRATKAQFDNWVQNVQAEYDVNENQMQIILNGLMVWCIENGTSPNINGVWVMMEGETQVEFPLKPIIDHAKPTLRQIMAHFSNVAEAYIEMRNQLVPYMPRYGLQRNLTDMSLARYAFDFYEMTSKTPVRAREAHIQMKAAALRGARNDLFGLDGNVGPTGENTERHTTDDVNRNMHNLLGMRGV